MLDNISIDQLRTFLAAAEEGSFSAAGRRLRRAQSVVSQTIANLETQLCVQLFDRSARLPVLTNAGKALVGEAQIVARSMDAFKARAGGLAGGLEPELSVVIDVMFPIEVLTYAVADFQGEFPDTPLRIYVEALGAVLQPVLNGHCAFAVMGSLPTVPPQLMQEPLQSVHMAMTAASTHPLGRYVGPIPTDELSKHVQLVLTDRTHLSEGREFAVISPRTWRLADLGAKHAFLRAGLGWGAMPYHVVASDLTDGTLVTLEIQDGWFKDARMPMFAVHRLDQPPGPAGRWLVERLKHVVQSCSG